LIGGLEVEHRLPFSSPIVDRRFFGIRFGAVYTVKYRLSWGERPPPRRRRANKKYRDTVRVPAPDFPFRPQNHENHGTRNEYMSRILQKAPYVICRGNPPWLPQAWVGTGAYPYGGDEGCRNEPAVKSRDMVRVHVPDSPKSALCYL